MYSKNILHCDIKPQNICFDGDIKIPNCPRGDIKNGYINLINAVINKQPELRPTVSEALNTFHILNLANIIIKLDNTLNYMNLSTATPSFIILSGESGEYRIGISSKNQDQFIIKHKNKDGVEHKLFIDKSEKDFIKKIEAELKKTSCQASPETGPHHTP